MSFINHTAMLFSLCIFSVCAGCNQATPLPPYQRPLQQLAAPLIGNITNGRHVFDNECSECHELSVGKNHKGPQLSRIYGAPSAQLTDYTRYSSAMLNSKVSWNSNNLNSYLQNPKQYIPGTKMHYDGLSSMTDRENVIAYLATLK